MYLQLQVKEGIIEGKRLLEAIHRANHEPQQSDMMPETEKIFLTIEVFASTADTNRDILRSLRETVAYWRQFIPLDGIPLDKLVSGRNKNKSL